MRSTMFELGARGNTTVIARAALRREISDGPLRIGVLQLARVLEERPDCLQRMMLVDVMSWPRSMQLRTLRRFLRSAGISEWALIGRLTDRQLEALVECLRGHRVEVR